MAGKKKVDGAKVNGNDWGGKRVAKVALTKSPLTKYTFPLKMTLEQKKKLNDYAWDNRMAMSEVLRNAIDAL